MRKKTVLSVLILAVMLVLMCAVVLTAIVKRFARRERCASHLRNLGMMIEEGTLGRLPMTADDAIRMLKTRYDASLTLSCPIRRDYIYVPYTNTMMTISAPKYPLLYDSSLDDHGDGVNILLLNGTVIWDKDASWLLWFARQHPEFEIPLPEGAQVKGGTGEE